MDYFKAMKNGVKSICVDNTLPESLGYLSVAVLGISVVPLFRQTDSRTVQIAECSFHTGGPKAESPLSQGPWPVFGKTLYTLKCTCPKTPPQIP